MPTASKLCRRCRKPLSKARLQKRKRNCYLCECATKRERKASAHDRRITQNGFTAKDYWDLYESQGGRCAIHGCRANGRTRYLTVDHDHHLGCAHDPKQWCRRCVRGLVCSSHNGWLGHAGDDPAVFESLAEYLRNPPARAVLKSDGSRGHRLQRCCS